MLCFVEDIVNQLIADIPKTAQLVEELDRLDESAHWQAASKVASAMSKALAFSGANPLKVTQMALDWFGMQTGKSVNNAKVLQVLEDAEDKK